MRPRFLKSSTSTDRKGSDEGAIAILVAAIFPLCMILLATATDLVHAVESTRALQIVADEASTAAVIAYGDSTDPATTSEMNTIVQASMNRLDIKPTFVIIPTSSSGDDGDDCDDFDDCDDGDEGPPCPEVKVILKSTVPTYFSSILRISSINISRSSRAMRHTKYGREKCTGGSATWEDNEVELLP